MIKSDFQNIKAFSTLHLACKEVLFSYFYKFLTALQKSLQICKSGNNENPTFIDIPGECPAPIAKITDEQKRDNSGNVGINPNQFKFNE